MKTIISALLAVALIPSLAFAQDVLPKTDQAAVEQVIENWNRAWQTKSAELAAQDYSDDATGLMRSG